MAELTAQGPSSDTPECCPVPCPAQPLGAAAQGETWGSNAQCLNHRASALESLCLREEGFDRQVRQIYLHWSKLLFPAWLPALSRDYPVQGMAALATNWCHSCLTTWPIVSAQKTCKCSFLLQPVNSSSETLAHATSSSKAVISSQQARQTSGTAMF